MTYEIKTTDEIKSNMIINVVNNVDQINDTNIGSVLDTFLTSISLELSEQYDDLQLIYEGTRISTAADTDLDELGALVGVARNDGEKALATVSFIRDNPASTDFIIPKSSQVSTQPNTDIDQYIFLTTEETTFLSTITDEEDTFVDGVFLYKFVSRFVDDITSITADVSATPTVLVKNTDYSLQAEATNDIIDTVNLDTLDDCDATTGWVQSDDADAPALNGTKKYQGTGSIELNKTPTTASLMTYTKTLSSVFDMTTLKTAFLNLYINDSIIQGNISKVTITIASDASFLNSYSKDITSFDVLWNLLKLTRTDTENVTTTGNPDFTNMKYLKFQITTINNLVTFVSGDITMDFWFLSNFESFYGNTILFDRTQTNPDDGTVFDTTYDPLSIDIVCEAQDVGVNFNVAVGKIIYKVSSISNINRINNYDTGTGGIDIEIDDDYRVRIQDASNLINVATVSAIRANVLTLDFIETCTILDLPLTEQLNEAHVYNGTSEFFILGQKIAQDDSELKIYDTYDSLASGIDDTVTTIPLNDASNFPASGSILIGDEKIDYAGKSVNDLTGATRGAGGTSNVPHLSGDQVLTFPYIKDTDYVLSDYNVIDFSSGASKPTNGNTVYSDYQYNKLGFFVASVTGVLGELTPAQITEVEDLIDTVKSAGISFTVSQPSYVDVDVTAAITIDAGFVLADVIIEVEDALTIYLNALEGGEDVLLAAVISTIMGISGVINTVVSDIGGGGSADFDIAITEKARAGTITIT